MRTLPDDLHTWLLGSCPSITGRSAGRFTVELDRHIARPEADICFCTLRWTSGSMPVCVKRFTHAPTRDLISLFQRAVHLRDALAGSDVNHPRLLACNASLAVIVMSMESGSSLEGRIVRSFFRGEAAFAECESLVRRTAAAAAAMHRIPVPEDAPMARTCSNREYAERLERSALSNRFVSRMLARSAFDPGVILNALPALFWERHENRLLHGDFQAKNVLLDARGKVILIDIDYGIGHPLRDVAQFLTQLERLYRRWRIPRARRMLKAYGAAFCGQFAREGFAHLMDDLPFFRLWTIAFALLADRGSSWPVRRLIRHDLQEGRSGLIFEPGHCSWMPAPGTTSTGSLQGFQSNSAAGE